jgi:flagellar hook-associated protein 1 FlgK
MSGGDLLGTSISGLLAFQRGLSVTGHNVSNANTDGYSRQRVDLVTRPPTPAGDGFIGNGVTVSTVQRVLDGFINGQLNSATASNGQVQQFYQLASQVDNLLSDPQAGLTPTLQNFFNAVQGVANDPTSIPARQVLLSGAQSLTDRFHYLNQRLDSLRSGLNSQITNSVSEINNLAANIAAVNRDIVLSQGAAGGQPANDLLDKRDVLVKQLSAQVGVTTVPQDDGSLNVFIGTGQTLVAGITSVPLSVVSNPYDPTRKEVAQTSGATSVVVSDLLSGGALGGTLQFRNQVLDAAQNALGRTAIGLAAAFNAQHHLGQDLNGNLGGDFFNTIDTSSPRVLPMNGATGTVSVAVTGLAALTASDYQLNFSAGNYTLTRLSDNTVVSSGLASAFPPAAVDGLTFTVGVAPVNGDNFLIQPTRTAANDVALAFSDVSRIAAAGPLRASEATNANGVPTNIGNGKIGPASATTSANLPLGGNITLTYVAATNLFTVTGGPGGTIAYNPSTQGDGTTLTLPAPYGNISFTMSGTPVNGDSFVLSNNTGAVSDNRNALQLADLSNRSLLINGTATIGSSYGQIVVDVGTQTHSADVNRNAQQALLTQVTDQRDSISGVNLDEEAANLQRFQQAYQAAAQMISASNTIFQTLLSAVRG